MTKLEAVNEMLEALGLPSVSVLDPGGTSEEAEAEVILDRYTDRIMQDGWSCNMAHERTFAASSGQVNLSGIYAFQGSKYGDHYTIRDGKLYDPVNDTDSDFDGDVTLNNVVFVLPFEQIEDHVVQYIIAEASLKFVRFKKQGIEEDRRYLAERNEARQNAKSVDTRLQNVNLNNTYEAYATRGWPFGRR